MASGTVGVLVQQVDCPGLPDVVVGGVRLWDVRAWRHERAIEGWPNWQRRWRRRGCARGQEWERSPQAEVSHYAAPW